jgi:hypothetical protein
VTGSLVLDTIPRFSLPQSATGTLELQCSQRIHAFSQKWSIIFPDLLDITDGLAALASLASYVNNHEASHRLWQEELFAALKVHPVAHRLLSMARYSVTAERNVQLCGLMIRETLRLASLLFIGLVKEHCRVYPSAVSENKVRLTRLLTADGVDWSSFMDLRLWVLTIAALAEEDERAWYVREIAQTMTYLGLAGWDESLKILKELIWIMEVLDRAADTLGFEVTGLLELSSS